MPKLDTINQLEQDIQDALEGIKVTSGGVEVDLDTALYNLVQAYGVEDRSMMDKGQLAGNFRSIYGIFKQTVFSTPEERVARQKALEAQKEAEEEAAWEAEIREKARRERKGKSKK